MRIKKNIKKKYNFKQERECREVFYTQNYSKNADLGKAVKGNADLY